MVDASGADGMRAGGTLAEAVGPSVEALLAQARAAGLAGLDAELLLQRASGLARSTLRAFGERRLGGAVQERFEALVRRRATGEPLAYIEGTKEFWSLPLAVSPAVLVPRPETELLVETCLAELPQPAQRVADLGTGSGAIALALAQERPCWQLLATDASMQALLMAQYNALRLGLRNVAFRHGRWCEALPTATAGAGPRWDAIVSNPPYVAPGDPALAALQHEPLSALTASDEGYGDLLCIAAQARQHLVGDGLLLLEHGADQAARLGRELVALGYARVVCRPDLAGHDRLTVARWPGP
jgi:release factor glutamine methyltransferase